MKLIQSYEHFASTGALAGGWKYVGEKYRNTSYIRRPFVGNKIVDHSDEVGASPVDAAPTTTSFST